MYKVILKKIKSEHSRLRTDIVEGECENLPTLGKQFRMSAKPIDPTAMFRLIETSMIKNIGATDIDYMEFDTENSKYSITIIASDLN